MPSIVMYQSFVTPSPFAKYWLIAILAPTIPSSPKLTGHAQRQIVCRSAVECLDAGMAVDRTSHDCRRRRHRALNTNAAAATLVENFICPHSFSLCKALPHNAGFPPHGNVNTARTIPKRNSGRWRDCSTTARSGPERGSKPAQSGLLHRSGKAWFCKCLLGIAPDAFANPSRRTDRGNRLLPS